MNYKELFKYYLEKYDIDQTSLNRAFQYFFDCDYTQLQFNFFNNKVNLKNRIKLNSIVNKINKDMPIEYIFNKAYFYGLELYVDKNCLIPRDETEELVEWVLQENDNSSCKVLDLCSGSGCIGLALKSKRSNWDIEGIDISKKCVDIGKKNSALLNLSINFKTKNLFSNETFDILVCNPPYISLKDNDVSDSVKKYEPHLALFTDDDLGLALFKKIFDKLSKKNFKAAYFEFGFSQKYDLIDLLNKYKFKYEFRKDINGKDRMLKITK